MDRDEALRLLTGGPAGVAEWNRRRGAGEEVPGLIGADLIGADLAGADPAGARLPRASLVGAHCGSTVFAEVDLSQVKGLESVLHGGPSEISVSTLIRSRGQIPESFLRGCGVPDALIAYLPSILGAMAPIQFYSCFIS